MHDNTQLVIMQVQYIGYFDTEEEAAVAYDREILRQRGPTAQTNLPLVRLHLLTLSHRWMHLQVHRLTDL